MKEDLEGAWRITQHWAYAYSRTTREPYPGWRWNKGRKWLYDSRNKFRTQLQIKKNQAPTNTFSTKLVAEQFENNRWIVIEEFEYMKTGE